MSIGVMYKIISVKLPILVYLLFLTLPNRSEVR